MSGGSRKRMRSGSAGGGAPSAARRGMFASMRFNKAFPSADFGRVAVKRGTTSNIAKYGESWRGASAEQRASRKSSGFSGRGLYTGRGGYWTQKLFGAKPGSWLDRAGDALAGAIPGGNAIAGGTAALHQAMSGSGLYTGGGEYVTNDTIASGRQVIPDFAPPKDGATVVISHKEFVTDIYGPEDGIWQNTTYSLNPGLDRTFPWLSQIAQNYDEFTLKQCIFTYRSSVTDFSSDNGQVGTVIMATQYNASDDPFENKQSMMEYDLAMSGKVSSSMLHGVECDPDKLSMAAGKYVRAGPPPHDEDLKTYDHGVLNIAISNIPTTFKNQAIGELWVSYTVELRKPKFFVNKGFGIARDYFYFQSAVLRAPANSAYRDLAPVFPGRLQAQQNSIGCSLQLIPTAAGSGSTEAYNRLRVVFPAGASGNYRIKVSAGCLAGFSPVLQFNYFGNIEPVKDVALSGVDNSTTSPWGWWSMCKYGGLTMYEASIRLATSTGGEDNGFEFWMTNLYVSGDPADVTVQAITVDVEEHNTRFNYKQDGSNDTIVLENLAGTTVIPSYTAG